MASFCCGPGEDNPTSNSVESIQQAHNVTVSLRGNLNLELTRDLNSYRNSKRIPIGQKDRHIHRSIRDRRLDRPHRSHGPHGPISSYTHDQIRAWN